MEEGHYKGNTKVGVAQLIRDHRGLWAMGGQDLILGYGEIRVENYTVAKFIGQACVKLRTHV